jgi:SAM-dependent methyltransferase
VNLIHSYYCRSARWTHRVESTLLPWVLDGVDLGPAALEVGPGYGVTTKVLAGRTAELTAVELDPSLARRLANTFDAAPAAGNVKVVNADATAMPVNDQDYSSVLCFTMLHHLPTAEAQDRLFAEAFRVLKPGGVFAGSDSQPSFRLWVYHIADTMTAVDPETLPDRLKAAGFSDIDVSATPRSVRFRARRT